MKRNKNLFATIIVLTVVLVALLGTAIIVARQEETPNPTTIQTNPPVVTDPTKGTETTDPPTAPPTEPPITKIATATISSVGDMLMHKPVFNACYNDTTGEYELELVFEYIYRYFNGADLAVGNLETTLAGPDFVHDNGSVGYSGYPQFNCPDSIIDAMKYTGFDVVLTANNHSYDTRTAGFKRTLEVIRERELQYLGTKLSQEEKDYIIVDCNGIRIGLLCYTYEDAEDPEKVAPNGHTMSKEDAKLIGTFHYSHLPVFYADVAENMAAMEAEGAEAIMLYLHWGEEYEVEPNSTQTTMAQELCNMGVDVIVGGHPHVVQPVQLLTSQSDESQKTLCLYSMGNALSNQRKDLMRLDTGHTEDGVMFSVTFAKYSDGTVIIEDADILPTWVNKCYDADWNTRYYILPLDIAVDDWQTAFNLTDSAFQQAQASYERTMALVGAGMEAADAYYAAHQQEVEASLGVQ